MRVLGLAFPFLVLLACDPRFEAPSNPLPISTGGGGGVGASGGAGGTGGGGTGGATGGTGGSATGGGGGSGGTGACGPSGASVTSGDATRFLFKGTIVPMTAQAPFVGELLVENGNITCVAASCAAQAGSATVIDTDGYVFPGMLDAHNHVIFDIFDEDDWAPAQTYTNHNQWPNDARYKAMVDTKQHLNGEAYTGATCMCGDGACKSGGGCGENSSNCPSDCVSFGCEMLKYGELKALIAGTTSVLGAPGGASKACYSSLARTIDTTQNGLGQDKIQTATPFPSTCTAKTVCGNFDDGSTDAYVVHIAEGVDASAKSEFDDLGTVTDASTTNASCSGAQNAPDPDCLYFAKTTIVHGAALDHAQIDVMAANQMKLVWSPRSNVFLYGAGTDLTKTADIPYILSKGITVALAPDWSIGGSPNLLEELHFAELVDDQPGWGVLSHEDLARMVTVNAATALGVEQFLGTLEVGKKADIMVVDDLAADPYDALVAAAPKDIVLTMVNGVVLYGDANLEAAAPQAPGCEVLDACCRQKFVCVATTSNSDLLDQTLSEIEQNLNTALANYDALNVTQWDFAPITPLLKCP